MTALPSFGYMLAAYRRARALTHEQLAEQVSCLAETIRQIEVGKLRPDQQMVELLAAQLTIPADERSLFVKAARTEESAGPRPMAHRRAVEGTPPPQQAARVGPAHPATLPQGMVTLLFTDIEGSTQLWERYPQAMAYALARHDALLREHAEAHHGIAFKTTGDGLHAAFARATDALAAALAAQRALRAEPWGSTGPLRVRMAIHTGVVDERDGDYFGPPVNRAARLLAAGHGGQILVSGATEQLVREQLPQEVSLRSMGSHRLKDLTHPEQIFQVTAADLPGAFPALRTLTAHHTNLPLQPTPLIGREQEELTLRDWLRQADVRLLTLTGPGGIGKTRLALQVAADMLSDFADGVFFVNLAPICEASLVAVSIAEVLGVRESSGQPLLARLHDELSDKHLLLLLDNFEHLVTAAPLVAELLAMCVKLKVVITSRQALHLRGEREFPVPPLALPPLERWNVGTLERSNVQMLAQYAAVALFMERARDTKPDFVITGETARTVAAICQRLDGLPLAIELAAARSKLLPPAALLARLEHRLSLLTSGARDLPPRQQTLRSTIGWSYDLLSPEQQALFRRLAVFVGGWTLDAAEAVCGDEETRRQGDREIERGDRLALSPGLPVSLSVLDGLSALLDQSLLRQVEGPDGTPRFMMLETIREYALERLAECGELEHLGRRHAAWYLALAQAAEPALTGPQQQQWLARLEQEHSNLRAALQSALDRQELEIALRFCAALWKFWQFHSHYSAGARWMDAALAQTGTLRSALRAQVLCGAGWLAFSQGDRARAQSQFEESLALARALGERQTTAMALHGVGQIAQLQGDYAHAQAWYEESLTLFRQQGDTEEIAWSLHHLGKLLREQGDNARALALFEECLALFRKLAHTWGESLALRHLGYLAYLQGDMTQATAWYQPALQQSRTIGDKASIASTLGYLAEIAALQGHYARAAGWFVESLTVDHELRDSEGVAWCLAGLAHLATILPRPEQAAQCFGATTALLDTLDIQLSAAERAAWDRSVAAVHGQLDEPIFATAWARGRGMGAEQAFEVGLQEGETRAYVPARTLPPPP